ncbi:MAG: hypothetical protein ACK4MQ_04370 [Hyphomonas sp.]
MRLAFAAGALALALAACGGTGGANAKMVKACTETGEDAELCSCLANGLEKNLDAKTFNTVANAMAAGDEVGEKIINDLPADEQAKIMGAMMSVGMTCAFGG